MSFLIVCFCFTCGGCGKPDQPGRLGEVLDRYQARRKAGPTVGNLAQEFADRAKEYSSVYHYTMAGQLFMIEGDFEAAIKNLQKAIATDPRNNAPHFLLAEAYYRLALFDMFDRGLCDVQIVPLDSLQESDLRAGHLRIEVEELLAAGRPIAYTDLLASKGLGEKERLAGLVYLLLLRKSEIVPPGEQGLQKILDDLGPPEALAVPHYRPDDRTKEILELCNKEMVLGRKGRPMKTPEGIKVVNMDIMEALAQRISSFLASS